MYALLQKITPHRLQKREPHIFPFLQKTIASQALEGEDVATPATHHQAAFTGPSRRHVGHTHARARRTAHGKVCNLKPILLHSWKCSPPSQTKKNMCSKCQQETQGFVSLSYGSRIAAWPKRGGMGRAGCSFYGHLGGGLRVLWCKEERSQHESCPQHITYKHGKLISYRTLVLSEISVRTDSY